MASPASVRELVADRFFFGDLMKKVNFKRLFRYAVTIMILTMVCHIIDFAMEFYDHRFMIGVCVGGLLMIPTFNALGKLKFFR